MSSFSANIPAKPDPFSFGLGNKDNWSFQHNLDLTLPKWLILKLATNYLPPYLFHPFQAGLNFSPPPHKNPPIFLATSLCDFWTSLKALSFWFHTSWGKSPQIVTVPEDLLCCIYSLHLVLNTQGGNKKEGEKMGCGCGNKWTCYTLGTESKCTRD